MLSFLFLIISPPPADPTPQLSDLNRFPPAWTVHEQRDRWLRHLRWLEDRRRYYPDDGQYRAWIAQAEWSLRVWVLLAFAHDSDFGPEGQVQMLLRLWDHLGEVAYRRGWTPPALPDGLPDAPRLPEAEECPGA